MHVSKTGTTSQHLYLLNLYFVVIVISVCLCSWGRRYKNFPKVFLLVPHNFQIKTENGERIEGGRKIIT